MKGKQRREEEKKGKEKRQEKAREKKNERKEKRKGIILPDVDTASLQREICLNLGCFVFEYAHVSHKGFLLQRDEFKQNLGP